MTDYEVVVGLEVHAELSTKTKIFCSCPTGFGAEPNTHTCPVCMAMPGALPVLNEKVVEYAVKAGLATNCTISLDSKNDRKNYFYPDNPKSYQISQFDKPLCQNGYVEIEDDEGNPKKIRILRIHIEEDAGKLNHNELLTYPNKFDQIYFGSVRQAYDLGAAAIGATIYFGSAESTRQIEETTEAFELAHELGMVTILWCYLRNESFKADKDYHTSADLTGQANHIGVTIEADIIKQKLPTNNGGFKAIKFGKTNDKVYSELTTENPIDLTRYQLANCYMGRAGLINSGGASSGESDFREAIETAIINKRAGGSGLICGRKAFQRPMKDGIELLNAIQDVYLDESITIA